jgi:hypothetical protein
MAQGYDNLSCEARQSGSELKLYQNSDFRMRAFLLHLKIKLEHKEDLYLNNGSVNEYFLTY